jgi:hypothetical protein
MYYSLIGTLLVAFCGYVISIATGGNENLDPKLLSPLFRHFYKPEIEMTVNGVTVKYIECGLDDADNKLKTANGELIEKVENGKLNIIEMRLNDENFIKTKS